MKTLGTLAAHYAQQPHTLALATKVTRRDGTVFRFTNHDRNITVGGELYLAGASSLQVGAVQAGSDGKVTDSSVKGMFGGLGVTDADVRAGRWDFAKVELFEFNWASPTDGVNPLLTGTLGEITTGREIYEAELTGLGQRLQQPVGRVYSERCDADLGDARCKVNLATYTVTGSITTLGDVRSFTDSTKAQAAGYFNGGKLTVTSGNNAGFAREIKTFVAGLFTFQQAFPFDFALADTFSVYPGCDKRHTVTLPAQTVVGDCKNKFSNVVNFQGFPFKPGRDALVKDA